MHVLLNNEFDYLYYLHKKLHKYSKKKINIFYAYHSANTCKKIVEEQK